MNNKEFAIQLESRTKKFAISIIKLSGSLPNNIVGNVIKNQITRSDSSFGANYREANRSRSEADFTNKLKICESEASETIYWLEIINEMSWSKNGSLVGILKESSELLAIFSSASSKLRT